MVIFLQVNILLVFYFKSHHFNTHCTQFGLYNEMEIEGFLYKWPYVV